jgi:hypothetical protein
MNSPRISSPPPKATTAAGPPRQGGVHPAVSGTLERLAAASPVAGGDAGAVEYASWLRLLRRPMP